MSAAPIEFVGDVQEVVTLNMCCPGGGNGGTGGNPFEFLGGTAGVDQLWRPMSEVTYAQLIDQLRTSGPGRYGDLLEFIEKYSAGCNDAPMAALIDAGKLDLTKDIKHDLMDSGSESAHLAGPIRRPQPINAGAVASDAGETSLQRCLRDSDGFFSEMFSWWNDYVKHSSFTADELAGLILWDYGSWLAIKEEPEMARKLVCKSPLFKEDEHGTLRAVSMEDLLEKLLGPIKASPSIRKYAMLQECPPLGPGGVDPIKTCLGDGWTVVRAPDVGASCLSAIAVCGVDSELLVDLSKEARDALSIFLETDTKISKRDRDTTLSRLVAVCFENTALVCVHWKNPGLESIASAVKNMCYTLQKGLEGSDVIVGGDFNFDASAPPGMTDAEVAELVDRELARGRLPEEVVALSAKFHDSATAAGLQVVPDAFTCTGDKQRSILQPQQNKLKRQRTAKDKVIVCSTAPYELGEVHIDGAETGIVPNNEHPADHYGVRTSLKRKRP